MKHCALRYTMETVSNATGDQGKILNSFLRLNKASRWADRLMEFDYSLIGFYDFFQVSVLGEFGLFG